MNVRSTLLRTAIALTPSFRRLAMVFVCLGLFGASGYGQSNDRRQIEGQLSKSVPFSITETLDQGEMAVFSVEQSVSDISVSVTGPSGQLFETTSANSVEFAIWKADVSGEYKLTVKHVGGPEKSAVTIRKHSLGPEPQTALAAFEKQLLGRQKFDPLDVVKAANAILDLEASVQLWKQSAFKLGVASASFDLGYTFNAAGDLTNALMHVAIADAIWRSEKFETATATSSNLLSAISLRRSQFPEAIEYANRAIAIYRKLGDTQGETEMLMLIGNYYSSTGEYLFALTNYELAIENWKKLGNQHRVGATLNNIGLLYSEQGDKVKALEYFELSLATFRADRPNTRGEANVLNQLGYYYLDKRDAKRAGEYFELSLPIWRRITDPYAEASALVGAGTVKMLVGDYGRSRAMFEEALALAKQRGSKGGEISANFGLARLERAIGTLSRSQAFIEKAIEIVESTRDSILEQQFRYGYFSRTQRLYEFYVDLLVEKGDIEAAFLLSERSRARALVEMIASSSKMPTSGIDSNLFEREYDLRQRANAAEQQRASAILTRRAKENVDSATAKLTVLLSELTSVQESIRKSSPRHSALLGASTADLASIQRELLDAETQLLQFKLGDEQSHLFVVSAGTVEVFRLPGRNIIDPAAIDFVNKVSTRDSSREDVDASGRRLADILLLAARRSLTGKRLLIVAEESLNSVPFSALSLEKGSYLIDRFELAMLPSAETLLSVRKYSRSAAKPYRSLIVADAVYQPSDPRLSGIKTKATKSDKFRSLQRIPATRREARTVATAFGANARSLTDLDASRSRLDSIDLSQFAYLHFATHGVLNGLRPELSGVVLSTYDRSGAPTIGLLSLSDIYELRLAAEMVVLSACESGLGRDVRGEGVIGLNRGFLFAGSRRVVSTLWKIDDVATGELMSGLYSKMLGSERLVPAAALREAQLSVRKQKRFESPYFWAGVILTGEWK